MRSTGSSYTSLMMRNFVSRSRKSAWRTLFDNDTYIIHATSGRLYKLIGISTFIWRIIDKRRSVEQIVQRVCDNFEIEREKVVVDILSFLQDLFDQGLISVDGKSIEQRPTTSIKDPVHEVPATHELWSKATKARIPIKVGLEITDKCNLNCCHCYLTGGSHSVISLSEAKSILDQIAEASCLFLTLTGGEPLTNKDCLDIMQYANEKAFSIRLLTNGTLITPKVADRIRNAKVSVEVSIYGAVANTHDKFTRLRGSFDATIKGIKLLAQRRVRVVMKFLITKANFVEVKRVQQLAQRLGVGCIANPLIFPRIDGSPQPVSYRVSDPQLRQLMRDQIYTPKKTKCVAALSKCWISPSGEVYPCELARIKVGDLKNQSFAEIWNSDEIKKLGTTHWFAPPDCCLKCAVSEVCPRCPAIAYFEDGSFRRPSSEACRIARTYYENCFGNRTP